MHLSVDCGTVICKIIIFKGIKILSPVWICFLVNKFLVSKETVVLRRWESET